MTAPVPIGSHKSRLRRFRNRLSFSKNPTVDMEATSGGPQRGSTSPVPLYISRFPRGDVE